MNQVFFGDCRDTLRQMAAQGIKTQSCVTSPPYFGLRSYMPDGVRLKPGLPDDALLHTSSFLQGIGVCPHSVTRKSDLPADLRLYFVPAEIGREETLAEYAEAMVSVFALVREVLADDGVLWLNLGDSYSSGSRQTRDSRQEMQEFAEQEGLAPSRVRADNAFRPKNLMGVPWRVALALQDDGWNLRQDIIWHKPNAMPESVTDRCTKAHEYLFLLSKSERYYWDSEAMQEDATGALPGNVNHKHTAEYESGNEKMRTKAGLLDYALRQRSKRDGFKREDSKRAVLIPGQSKATHRPDRPEGEGDLTKNSRASPSL